MPRRRTFPPSQRTIRQANTRDLAEDAVLYTKRTNHLIEELSRDLKSTTLRLLESVKQSDKLKHDLMLTRQEVGKLRRAVLKSNTLIMQLLDDPDAQEHAKAVVRDFQYQKYRET